MRLDPRAILLMLVALALVAGLGALALFGEDWFSDCHPYPTTINGVAFGPCEVHLLSPAGLPPNPLPQAGGGMPG